MGNSSSKGGTNLKSTKSKKVHDSRNNNVVYNVPGTRSQLTSGTSENAQSNAVSKYTSSEMSRRSDSIVDNLPNQKKKKGRRSSLAKGDKQKSTFSLRKMVKPGDYIPNPMVSGTQSLVLSGAYSLRDFTVVERVGTGELGNVFLCQHALSGLPVAIKSVSKEILTTLGGKEAIRMEKRLLQRLTLTNCPFTVKSYCVFQDNNNFYFVTEYVPGGELDYLMHDQGLFAEPIVRFYVAEILLALQHMHQLGYAYRDLRPENVLLGGDGHIRLVDFGSSVKLKPNESTFEAYVWDEEGAEYLSPQVILNRGYGQEVDCWALGVLTYEMLCGHTPFKSASSAQMYQRIRAGDLTYPPDLDPPLTDECMNFIHALLNPDTDQRLGMSKPWAGPGINEVFEHPFLRGVDWEALKQRKIEPPYVCHPGEGSDDDKGMNAFDTLAFQVSKGRLPKIGINKGDRAKGIDGVGSGNENSRSSGGWNSKQLGKTLSRNSGHCGTPGSTCGSQVTAVGGDSVVTRIGEVVGGEEGSEGTGKGPSSRLQVQDSKAKTKLQVQDSMGKDREKDREGSRSENSEQKSMVFADDYTGEEKDELTDAHPYLKDFDAVFRYLPNGLVTTVTVTPSAKIEELMCQAKMFH